MADLAGEQVTAGLGATYDYVVASGTFNLLVEGHDAFFRRAVATMYDACRVGVAFNVLEPVPGLDERVANRFGETYFSLSRAELVTTLVRAISRFKSEYEKPREVTGAAQ